jgi:hypothetical protein
MRTPSTGISLTVIEDLATVEASLQHLLPIVEALRPSIIVTVFRSVPTLAVINAVAGVAARLTEWEHGWRSSSSPSARSPRWPPASSWP